MPNLRKMLLIFQDYSHTKTKILHLLKQVAHFKPSGRSKGRKFEVTEKEEKIKIFITNKINILVHGQK